MKRLFFLLVELLILTTNMYSQDVQNSQNIEINYSYNSEHKIHNYRSTAFKISTIESENIYCGINVWTVDGDETAFITFMIAETLSDTNLFPIEGTEYTQVIIRTENFNLTNKNSLISNIKNLRKDTSSALIDFNSDNQNLTNYDNIFRHRFILSELCDNDITSITIGKHTFKFNEVKTSKIFSEIFSKLVEKTGNELYKYMGFLSRSFGKLDKSNRK